jgi:hypothetical protein
MMIHPQLDRAEAALDSIEISDDPPDKSLGRSTGHRFQRLDTIPEGTIGNSSK